MDSDNNGDSYWSSITHDEVALGFASISKPRTKRRSWTTALTNSQYCSEETTAGSSTDDS